MLTTGDGRVAAIAAANGLGGIGKTALATEVVRRLHDSGAFADGIAVVICKELTDPIVVLRRVLARFMAGQREPEEDTLAALGSRAAALFEGKHALVVLDNVEQGWPLGEVLAPLRAAGATLLLTSRAELPAVPRAASLRLDMLPPAEALDVFAEYYGRGTAQDLTAAEQRDARASVEALGRHTLAVKLAAANAATLQRPLATVAQELHDHPRGALLLENGEEVVGYVLESSYAALSEAAQRLYVALAAFATPDVGRKALLAVGAALGDETATENALRDIVALRLADAKPDDTMPPESDRERIRLHSLVRSDVEARFARWPEDTRAAAMHAVAAFYAEYTNAVLDSGVVERASDETNITSALEWAHDNGEGGLVVEICSRSAMECKRSGATRGAHGRANTMCLGVLPRLRRRSARCPETQTLTRWMPGGCARTGSSGCCFMMALRTARSVHLMKP